MVGDWGPLFHRADNCIVVINTDQNDTDHDGGDCGSSVACALSCLHHIGVPATSLFILFIPKNTGVGDACDSCPLNANTNQTNTTACDPDQDSVDSAKDTCPCVC